MRRSAVQKELPEGLRFLPEFLPPEEELALVAFASGIAYGEVRMHGVTARRRVAHFGWHYSFDGYKLTPAEPVPAPLLPLRERTAAETGITAEEFSEALLIEYQPGAGIGWHRDAPPFGIIAGISLAGTCKMRFQKGTGADRMVSELVLPPRSMYLLTGSARKEWQHSIPPTKELRYSITFRTMRWTPKS